MISDVHDRDEGPYNCTISNKEIIEENLQSSSVNVHLIVQGKSFFLAPPPPPKYPKPVQDNHLNGFDARRFNHTSDYQIKRLVESFDCRLHAQMLTEFCWRHPCIPFVTIAKQREAFSHRVFHACLCDVLFFCEFKF